MGRWFAPDKETKELDMYFNTTEGDLEYNN